jgi:hypothetical protein
VEFIAAHVKTLAAVGRGERGRFLCDEIDRLIAQGTAKGHHSWVRSLNEALYVAMQCATAQSAKSQDADQGG